MAEGAGDGGAAVLTVARIVEGVGEDLVPRRFGTSAVTRIDWQTALVSLTLSPKLTMVSALDAAQLVAFSQDGFLVLRDLFFSSTECDALRGEEADLQGVRFESLETQPGDACIFGAFVPHRSGLNRTQAPRRVLYLTYNKASEGDHYESYFADKRKSYPPDIERPVDQPRRYRV